LPRSKPKSLKSLLQSSEAAASAKPRKSTPATSAAALVVKSISLTPDAEEALVRLQQEAGESIKRKVSASAVVRALLALADRQNLDITAAIELELNSGSVVWGSRRG